MRFWPRSLKGQLLFAIALSLLLAQTISAILLYRAQTELREAGLVHTAAFRLLNAERPDRPGDRRDASGGCPVTAGGSRR